jgi:hypothetical protein
MSERECERLELPSNSSISSRLYWKRERDEVILAANSYTKGYSLLQLTHASELGNALGGSGGLATPALN